MPLATGTRVGTFEITGALGAGGMGEVYRARDSKLHRDVAIKVLPELLALDPDRLTRFDREAQVLASLNHPNIAHVYGVEHDGGVHALVMELVEGEDLSQRIRAGAIPLEDALPMARQIAAALEAAHERGIIHRDLKPANIKVRDDGTVKVLDFGLAKALDPAAVPGRPEDAVHSPTFTSPMTQVGVVLGTAAYMSPEQAKGRAVDRRADIWAFGCVLFEMLTTKRAFPGDDITDTLAAIIRGEPDWNALPAETPASIRRLLRRCLEKDAKQRLSSMGDARLDLEEVAATPAEPPQTSPRAGSRRRAAAPWTVAAAALTIAALAIAVALRPASPDTRVTRLNVDLGFEASLYTPFGAALALSSDGRTIVASAEGADRVRRLYVRTLDRLETTVLAGTEDAVDPFLSPDDRWIGFFARGKLRKIALTGGASVEIADIEIGRGGAWGEDGSIYFTPRAAPGGQVMRVAAEGGAVTAAGPLLDQHQTQRWPQVLPGGKALLYTGHTAVDEFENAALVVQPLPGGAPRELLKGGYHWRYVPGGYIVYVHAGTLFAVPFDIERLAVTGAAVPIIEGIVASPPSAGAQVAVSRSGTMAYVRGQHDTGGPAISWLDLDGKVSPLKRGLGNWNTLAISPDGGKIVMDVADAAGSSEIWVYDIARDTQARLTVNNVADLNPIWTRDGSRIVFSSAKDNAPNLFWQPADGSAPAERLLQSPKLQVPNSWDPQGRRLIFTEIGTNADLFVLTLPEKTVAPFLVSPANELQGAISPDGRWIAYASDESGPLETYVRPFPSGDARWLVSRGGGGWPIWSPRTKDLYYSTVGGQALVVPYSADGPSFQAGNPREVPNGQFSVRGNGYGISLHPDGRRFALGAMQGNRSEAARNQAVLVFNFGSDLKARVK